MTRSYIEHIKPTYKTSSSRQAAPTNPKREGRMEENYPECENQILDETLEKPNVTKQNLERHESERIHDWIIEQIPEAKNMNEPPIKNWLIKGASFEDDIKPVILRDYKKLQESKQQIGNLGYFTKHILNQVENRTNEKEPEAKAKLLEEPKEIKEFQESEGGLYWRDVCEGLKNMPSVGVDVYISWIAQLQPERFQDGVVALKAPTRICAKTVKNSYLSAITLACQKLNPNVREVRIAV